MTFENWHDEATKFNNEIVEPAYRKFCKENDLVFHFSDELPKGYFNPIIANEEQKLHNEAMICFNSLNPKFVFFNNKIYTYNFTVWGGEFESKSCEIEEFLNQAHEQVNRNVGLEKQLKSALDILQLISAIAIIIIINFLGKSLFVDKFDVLFFILGIVIAIISTSFIKKRYFSNPLQKYSSEINKHVVRLERLKQKFNTVGADL